MDSNNRVRVYVFARVYMYGSNKKIILNYPQFCKWVLLVKACVYVLEYISSQK